MSSAKLPTRVLVAFGCVYFFWGSTYVAMRYGVQVLPPFVIGTTRYLVAGPLMLGICAARGMKLRQSPRDFAILAVIGILLLGIGNTACLWCEQYLPSGLAALLLAVIPLYVALIEVVLPRGEGLRARGWVGIGVGLVGLVILLSPGWGKVGGDASEVLVASVVLILAGFAWSCGSVISRRSQLATSAFVAAAWEMVFGGVFNAGLLAVSGEAKQMHWSAQGFWAIAWLVVFGSLVGYSAFVYLLDHVPVAKVSTYAYINPIVAVVLGAIVLQERLVPVEYAGMAAILVAVYLVTSSKMAAEKMADAVFKKEVEPVS